MFWSMLFWGLLPKCSSFPSWIPYFEASNLRTFAIVFLEKVSLPKFLIIISRVSLTRIFFNIIAAIKDTHGYLFRSMTRILKVESKTFCWRDGTRIVSQENSFACKQSGKTPWLAIYFFWLCWSRVSAMSIECKQQRFTLWISRQAF